MDRRRDLPHWPHAEVSRFTRCPPHDWHIQEMGDGPLILLLHGAGGSTHSWRDVMTILAQQWRVVAIDLPGQGFTRAGTLTRAGLAGMSADIAELADAEGWQPVAIVGHSAGAVIALNLVGRLTAPGGQPPIIVGINAALGRFKGTAGWLFPLLARALALNPFTASIFTFGGRHEVRARRVIGGTGSRLDATGVTFYARLFGDRAHADATLQMMARWKVDAVLDRLPEIATEVLLITGASDLAVPPETSEQAAARLPKGRTFTVPDLGHLAHEEAPERVTALIQDFLFEIISVDATPGG